MQGKRVLAGRAMSALEFTKRLAAEKELIAARKFRDSMVKALKAKSRTNFDDIDELKKKLRVGDILYTKPRSMEGESLSSRIFYKAESIYQGSKYTHTGLYVGNGQVVDAGIWGKGLPGSKKGDDTRVHLVDLDTFKDRYNFKVLRVDATAKERHDATRWAKKQIGKDFNTGGVVKMVINPLKGKAPKIKDRTDNESFFCSELVANAYAPHTALAVKKKLKHTLPGDIFRSTNTKTIAKFEKEAMLRALMDELRQIAES